jgi:hypothetical protein
VFVRLDDCPAENLTFFGAPGNLLPGCSSNIVTDDRDDRSVSDVESVQAGQVPEARLAEL